MLRLRFVFKIQIIMVEVVQWYFYEMKPSKYKTVQNLINFIIIITIIKILSEEYYSDEHTQQQLTPTKENLMLKDELTPENMPPEADGSPNKHLLSNYVDNLQKLSHIHKVRKRLVR